MSPPANQRAESFFFVGDDVRSLHSLKVEMETPDVVTYDEIVGPHDFPSCRMVVIADPDGNRITLHKRKPRAS